VSWLDGLLILLTVLAVAGGYRRGAVLQVVSLLGLALGVTVGVVAAPHVAGLGEDPMTHVGLALGAVLVGGAIGNLLGWIVGSRVRARAHGTRLRRADAVSGSVISVVALVLATWFLALNLADGPFPQLARGIRSSRIVREMDSVLPPPPSMLGQAQRVLSLLGFPDVFVGLPPAPAAAVPPPSGTEAASAFRAARASTVEVLGRGCSSGFLNQGSGFVVRPGVLVTNAHVVAGTTTQWVHASAGDFDARVVLFDPELDIAVLRVPDLPAPPLSFAEDLLQRGDGGAVLGYPGGGPLTAGTAAVRQVIEPVGRDIYGQSEVHRLLYEIQARIRQGNSGGPFVLGDGRVAGVVFASSVLDERVGYAIVSSEVAPLVREALDRVAEAGTGTCAG
jgi:S1-C subfamily serine protease